MAQGERVTSWRVSYVNDILSKKQPQNLNTTVHPVVTVIIIK